MISLVLNCGSSTLKFGAFECVEGREPDRLTDGIVDDIGGKSTVTFHSNAAGESKSSRHVSDHADAVGEVLGWLRAEGIPASGQPEAVGHRIVHGGLRFSAPALIDDEALQEIEKLTQLAPLHNAPALAALRAAMRMLGPHTPMVAVFDTSFHRTMPETAEKYAIPHDIAENHGILRYGFHGIAHQSMMEQYGEFTGTSRDDVNIVTLQLGNGCSAAAIRAGRSIDTSMGLTPLEGLVMGTRSGDVDPALAGYIAEQEGISQEESERILNTRSGLLGVSGVSRDMRELLKAERQGNPRAKLAVDMFCIRARKYVGAYLAAMGGADAIVFGGGIGENSPEVRQRICDGLDWFGLTLDDERNNDAAKGAVHRISADGSRLSAYVIAVDEEHLIARETARLLRRRQGALP
jgi:acetate kinase